MGQNQVNLSLKLHHDCNVWYMTKWQIASLEEIRQPRVKFVIQTNHNSDLSRITQIIIKTCSWLAIGFWQCKFWGIANFGSFCALKYSTCQTRFDKNNNLEQYYYYYSKYIYSGTSLFRTPSGLKKSVLYKEVSLFQRLDYTHLKQLGPKLVFTIIL